eukprot:5899723-Amphidinium_carterae.3
MTISAGRTLRHRRLGGGLASVRSRKDWHVVEASLLPQLEVQSHTNAAPGPVGLNFVQHVVSKHFCCRWFFWTSAYFDADLLLS